MNEELHQQIWIAAREALHGIGWALHIFDDTSGVIWLRSLDSRALWEVVPEEDGGFTFLFTPNTRELSARMDIMETRISEMATLLDELRRGFGPPTQADFYNDEEATQ